jgi:hypothetical protein
MWNTEKVSLTEAENRMVVIKGWGEEGGRSEGEKMISGC